MKKMLKDGIPQRRCIGCMNSIDQTILLRMAVKDGRIIQANKKTIPGRGIYLCKNEDCLKMAIKKKAFNRVIKGVVNEEDLDDIKRVIRL